MIRPGVPHSLESTRQEWEEGYRQLQAQSRDRARYARLADQVEILRDELRRRVGQTFTISELAQTYAEADGWVRETLAELATTTTWPRTMSLVEAAAFYLHARGATDYAP
jgi:hypothetical protein